MALLAPVPARITPVDEIEAYSEQFNRNSIKRKLDFNDQPQETKDQSQNKDEKVKEVGFKYFRRYTQIRSFDLSYYEKIEVVINQITNWVEENYQKHFNPAVVMDIDETILDRNYEITEEFYPALDDSLYLYQYLQKVGIPIFFITARPPRAKEITEQNLELVGFRDYQAIYYLDLNETKEQYRYQITKKGYTIIACIGDQDSDLGPPAIKNFKMPGFY